MNEEETKQIDIIDNKMKINRVYRLLNRIQFRNFSYHNALHLLNEKKTCLRFSNIIVYVRHRRTYYVFFALSPL